MAQVTATIASKVGLHARPAATFVKAVAEKGVPVTIAKEGGAAVDASSILGVMTLGSWRPSWRAENRSSRRVALHCGARPVRVEARGRPVLDAGEFVASPGRTRSTASPQPPAAATPSIGLARNRT